MTGALKQVRHHRATISRSQGRNMARQITVEEMQEPDVDYILPDGMKIPKGLRKELEHRVGTRVHNAQTGKAGTKYRIPAYLMRDWLKEFGGDNG
jgi:hypothetical protein